MKIRAEEVWTAYLVLEITKQRAAPMPDSAKYWLARLGRKLKSEFQVLNEKRDDIIKSYNHLNENGVFYVPPEQQDDFNRRWRDVASTEIEVSSVDARPLSFFRFVGAKTDEEDGPLTVKEMVDLGPFIAEEASAVGQVTH